MSDLADINASGNLSVIKLGNNLETSRLLTQAEIDTTVADALTDALMNPVTTVDYDPQDTPPSTLSGRTFFDEESQSLSVYTDIPDFTQNLGQEEVTRVYNNTGSNIPNGTVCRGDGATGGFPNATPALADSLINATVIGIATHGIPTATFGFLTHTGGLSYSIADANVDDTVYLSDTVPGGMTNISPDIACVLGVKLTGDKMQVNIENHKTLPIAIGWLTGISATYDLVADGSWTPLVSWDADDSIYMTVDAAAGTVELPSTGVFRVSVTFSATFTADGKDSRTFRMDLFDTFDNTELAAFSYPMPLDTASITGTFTAPFRSVANHTLQLRIGTELEDVDGVTFSNINFSVESIQIR